jgi:hypothetical protein
MPISLPQKASQAVYPAPYRRTILACTRPILVGHPVELATAQPPPTTTARSKPTPRLAQHACASFEHQAPTQADHEPGMDAAGDHADPAHPSRTAACPTAALQDLTSAGHSGRGNAQTPDAHTGRRTADAGQRTPGRSDGTGHWTPVRWAGKSRHWSLAPDTGHWTLAEDVEQGDEGAAGIRTSWATTPSDARWDAQPCSCGRRLRRSTAHAARR